MIFLRVVIIITSICEFSTPIDIYLLDGLFRLNGLYTEQ